MIAQLRGHVVRVAAPTLVLDVNGVGYRVSVPASVLENLPTDGTPLTLITHMQVREDDMSLFGFLDDQELEVFNLLLSVSGVGPKASLAMLSALGSVGIAKAVAGEDVRTLTKVPGIGTRTAQRDWPWRRADDHPSWRDKAKRGGAASGASECPYRGCYFCSAKPWVSQGRCDESRRECA